MGKIPGGGRWWSQICPLFTPVVNGSPYSIGAEGDRRRYGAGLLLLSARVNGRANPGPVLSLSSLHGLPGISAGAVCAAGCFAHGASRARDAYGWGVFLQGNRRFARGRRCGVRHQGAVLPLAGTQGADRQAAALEGVLMGRSIVLKCAWQSRLGSGTCVSLSTTNAWHTTRTRTSSSIFRS